MQRIRVTKLFPHLLANSKSFTTSSSLIIPPLPKRPCISPFAPFSSGFITDRRNNFRLLNKPKSVSISTSLSSSAKEAMAENAAPLLSAVNDLHGGVRVEMKEPINPQEFGVLLRASMSQWRAQEKKGIWIKLPIELANLVEIAVKEGFRYHHAESDYLMLVHWIPVTADTLPANASHSVGIGAFVMKDNGEVLVVQEKTGRFKGLGVWKYPTGVVNEGEDICTAAIREVKEETGIDTEFVEVLAFRESHKLLFTKSDLFFVCMLKPRSFDIQIQVVEIEAAKWMPVEEYEAQPFIQNHKLFNLVAKICRAKSVADYTGFSPWSTTTASGKTTSLYFNNQYIDRIQSSGDHHSKC
ncbi:nudix hydrolase 2 [Morus notabilis]|uniref:nudix hydrolase 2 n=1 Tax=Morus notabilis TaxID=981085 RepID=UPI000CED07CB|nr:nudix hydrolase 2 [Morus notabilis]